MIDWLAKILIRNPDTCSAAYRRSYGALCSILGVVLNLLLFGGKYFAGLISGSVALTADALNNLADVASSLVTLIGFKLAAQQPDHRHPFGHGRMEYLSGLIVSFLIVLMGIEVTRSSIAKIANPAPLSLSLPVAIISLTAIAVKLYMAYYNRRIGRRIDSAGMKATAIDSLSDAASTTVIFISMLVYHFYGLNVDGWCGLLVALLIIYAGIKSAKDAISHLLGRTPQAELIHQIEDIACSYDDILGVHDLVVHDYGPGRLMISLHVEVPGNSNVFVLHDLIDSIERRLHDEIGCDAVLHMDPVDVDNQAVAHKKQEIEQLIASCYPEISIHDFRMISSPAYTTVLFDAVLPFNHQLADHEAAAVLAELISSRWEDHVAIIDIDHPYVQRN